MAKFETLWAKFKARKANLVVFRVKIEALGAKFYTLVGNQVWCRKSKALSFASYIWNLRNKVWSSFGAKFEAQGAKFEAQGAKFVVQGTKFEFHSAKFEVQLIKF